MKPHADKLKLSLNAEALVAIKRAHHAAPGLVDENASGVAITDLPSNIEDDIGIAAGNDSVLGLQAARVSSDGPVALDKLCQHRVGLKLMVVQTRLPLSFGVPCY